MLISVTLAIKIYNIMNSHVTRTMWQNYCLVSQHKSTNLFAVVKILQLKCPDTLPSISLLSSLPSAFQNQLYELGTSCKCAVLHPRVKSHAYKINFGAFWAIKTFLLTTIYLYIWQHWWLVPDPTCEVLESGSCICCICLIWLPDQADAFFG